MIIEPLEFEIPDNLIASWGQEAESSADPRYVEKKAEKYFRENYQGDWSGKTGWLWYDDRLTFALGYNEFYEEEYFIYYG